MFIGHIAVGLASKRAAPRASLGPLMLAALFIDLLAGLFELVGWEHFTVLTGQSSTFLNLSFDYYPLSHSLLATTIWATVLAVFYRWMTGYRRGSAVVWTVVMSHWLLDAVTHRPDLALYPGSEVWVGLGLWAHPVWTVIFESALFALGIWIYARSTESLDGIGRWGLWSMVVFLSALYTLAVFESPSPQTSTVDIILASMIIGCGTVGWCWWFDGHRRAYLSLGEPDLSALKDS